MCGSHYVAKHKILADSSSMCVKQGKKDVLVVGQKVRTLECLENDGT